MSRNQRPFCSFIFFSLVLSFATSCASRQVYQFKHFKRYPSELIADSFLFNFDRRSEVSWPGLLEELRGVSILILGEIHDEPSHHLFRSELIRALSVNRKALIGFEQISSEQNEFLKTWQSSTSGDLGELREKLRWDQSGWPAWNFYEPIFEAALQLDLELLGLDLKPKTLKELRETGEYSGFNSGKEKLPKLPNNLQKDLEAELIASHSFPISEAVLQKMQLIQRARDFHMASQLASQILEKSSEMDFVVGIMGNGHARKDRGVPFYLRRQIKDSAQKLRSICFGRLVSDQKLRKLLPAEYSEKTCDFVVLTPKI